ncbi:beta-galactosidase [Chitinophaga oryzae]|uniref:Beta-galactosidase n=1 Tax=Chitinophaga oryzae TaxID=2725414 RepID=A0AAE6ZHJ9_9BACT|nr:beta-galactosidase [Chitinophaga oryzae]QJB31929.1 beta-galactosidase [Chitinophaga oryzae]
MKKCILLLWLLVVLTVSQAFSRQDHPFFPAKRLITTGIYYYPEHWDPHLWERDIKRMSEMGFEFVHLAEFAWSRMEPEEGKYDFTWLDTVMDLCTKYHLKVVLCTPSATPPAWIRSQYPETFQMNSRYIRGEHGTRGLGSVASPVYRRLVETIVTKMAQRYGKHENVIGWQLDNEPDAKPDFSPASQEAFRQWLKNKYHSIDTLNAVWGNAFWSQWYNSFEQVLIPNVDLVGWWGSNPHAVLDFKRYMADIQAEYLDFQSRTLRANISKHQFITTNYTAVSPGADPRRTTQLDFATYTAYPNGGTHNIGQQGFRLGNSNVILFAAEYYKSTGGVTGAMEIQPGTVNWGNFTPLPLPGTVRMWLYHIFAAGGRLACSYRFRQINYGAEQYHSGIMETDGVTPSPGGYDYMEFMKEMNALRKEADIKAPLPGKLAKRSTAILWNLENYWSFDQQRQTRQWDTWNYPIKFLQIAKSFGAQADVVPETADLSAYNFVIIPAYELVDSSLIKKWEAYAANGGHLILTCRTATKNRTGYLWEKGWAAPLFSLIGARISAFDMLPDQYYGDVQTKTGHYRWNNWGDLLQPDKNTEAVAVYNDQFYKGAAAVVKRRLGKGTVTYIGVDTDDDRLEKDVLRDIYTAAGATTENYPPGVLVYWRDGFYVAVNYSSDDYTMNMSGTAKVLIGEKTIKPGGVLVWKE